MTADAPIRLATLGRVELAGPDAAGCGRVLAQPKRLALLSYLAARPHGERVRRDRLMAVFWPELPSDRARGNVRIALHFLRSALGRQVIVSEGGWVAVVPERLECDAAALLDPPAGAEPESLLDLHRGEFLDALHVSGAPDFERWVDRTRAALRARATELAWSLAERAERSGEWITAAGHARRAADLAVDVEGATQRLIRLLDRAGDRAAAVLEYEKLESWLEAEFEIPPSPETRALIDAVRGRTGAASSASWPAVRSGRDRPSLAVLPFDDPGVGAGPDVASGMTEDLLTAFSRIRGVRVLSRTSVRRFETSPPSSMREVRDLLGADLVVAGSVRVSGGRARIAVQLIDARLDEQIWAESYDRRLTDLFEIQSDVALRVTRALEAELSPREHDRLRRPPTADLRAWQLYLRGREALRSRDPMAAGEAVSLFRQAIVVDGGFAQAWSGLADASLVRMSTGPGSIPAAVTAAKHAVGRALECDPDLGEAWASLGLIHTFFECDQRAAGREYRRAVELSPGYATGHQWYGNWLCAWGDDASGLRELDAAVDLDPLAPAVADSVALALYHLGRLTEAEERSRQTLELHPDFWRSRLTRAVCMAARGDSDGAAAEMVRVWACGGYGAPADEAAEAARILPNGAAPAFEYMLARARARAAGHAAVHVVELILLSMLDRTDEAIATMATARRAGSLGLALQYAPVLDPLADRPRFRQMMHEIGLMLPRWSG